MFCCLGLLSQMVFAQQDSLRLQVALGLRGRWQTGNLNQLSLMPNGRVALSNATFKAEVATTYHFLKVNGFNAINDLVVL